MFYKDYKENSKKTFLAFKILERKKNENHEKSIEFPLLQEVSYASNLTRGLLQVNYRL